MIAVLKFWHITTIAIWAAGLISLPGLYVQRAHVGDKEALYRLQMMVRFAYVTLISPAAFLAVVTGLMLIFGQQTFAGWFSIKMYLVACLVILHVLTGLVIIRLFHEGETYPVWRFVMATAVTCILVLAVLFVALAKPAIHADFTGSLFEPGGLHPLIEAVNPWATP
ncbi:CopD family protein [Neorhizobium sp. T786]|uniref:CopD family protein n=1 Tax=Pseudorhizobium xiangyangii TaxID=2883104 RepID=UPI001CFF65F3|nr:CopD family protein [Neorhizobium xiangyangii]MCB5204706.1 CopD family protein [Neorhizobium xiangyangii]